MSKVSPASQAASAKKKAAGSSFYLAMRLMPKRERDAMFAIYAFCRRVDDIADDGLGTRSERRDRLEAWRYDLEALYGGQKPQRVSFLAPAVEQFGLRKVDFLTVLDGMEMDVAEDIVAPDLATLDLYCERVASAVGRLSIKVFGMEEEPGFALAHNLGRALQLTNILRDIDEDAGIGRLYLPREYLFAVGFKSLDPRMVVSDGRVDGVCRGVAALAHDHYGKATAILAEKPKGRIATPRLMGAVYR
ncbi:MAG TPA: squalene/phytoene synthase family protein, partial [Rhizomicrobium sp.]|nr:squalene/phytoene synthase family protein [Rhizomicrobium sp.]